METHVPSSIPQGKRATAAGRWVARAARLLAAHPNTVITAQLHQGRAQVDIAPSKGMNDLVGAHARMACQSALGNATTGDLFQHPTAHLTFTLSLQGIIHGPVLKGRFVDDAQGSMGFETSGLSSWANIAQTLGVVCEAMDSPDPYNQALLWTLNTPANGAFTLGIDRVLAMIARAPDTLARQQGGDQTPASSAYLGVVFPGTLVAPTDITPDCQSWMERCATNAIHKAKEAFSHTQDALGGPVVVERHNHILLNRGGTTFNPNQGSQMLKQLMGHPAGYARFSDGT